MHIAKYGWALAGSLGLHILVAGLLRQPTPPRQKGSVRVVVVQAELISEPARLSVTSHPPAKLAQPPTLPSVPLTAKAPPIPERSQQPLPAATDTDISDNVAPLGYLPIDAVDEPAVPLGDWIIDTEVLPPHYTLRLVLTLWISAEGTIDKWELQDETGNQALARQALAYLDKTPIQPALLNHIAVPSFRRLEIVISHE